MQKDVERLSWRVANLFNIGVQHQIKIRQILLNLQKIFQQEADSKADFQCYPWPTKMSKLVVIDLPLLESPHSLCSGGHTRPHKLA